MTGEPRVDDVPRPKMDRFLRGLARLVLGTFFRRVEVVGVENMPASGPVIVVANHHSSLIDGVLVTGYLPRIPRMLAASTIWAYRPIVPLLKAAGVIALMRRQDVGFTKAKAKAQNTFAKAAELVGKGGVLALFPEGRSHSEPGLIPIKSGAARIALEVEANYGPNELSIVPVGILFEEKTRFRSRVLLHLGAPVQMGRECNVFSKANPAQQREMVRDLTARIGQAMADVSLSPADWDAAAFEDLAADLWTHRLRDCSGKDGFVTGVARRRLYRDGHKWMREHYPDMVDATTVKLGEYRSLLLTANLPGDAEVARTSGLWAQWLLLTLAFPAYLLAMLLNFVPFEITRGLAWGKDEDKMSTWSLFSAIFLFPLCWLVQGAFVAGLGGVAFGTGWNWWVFAATVLMAPILGYLSLGVFDLRLQVIDKTRIWRHKRRNKGLAPQIEAAREEALECLSNMINVYVAEGPEAARRRG